MIGLGASSMQSRAQEPAPVADSREAKKAFGAVKAPAGQMRPEPSDNMTAAASLALRSSP